ncbi:MAG: DUF389 domain-containing protein [Paludibacteraceae bacterium]|nr:DUF389 domain-containing protein [Paludibacteraceae bacterium]
MSFKDFWKSLGQYLHSLVSLSADVDTVAATEAIKKDIPFRGPNVYILFFAIMIASLGLNVNSIPVIIGAMLISPLMGPIIGLGLSVGTNDIELLKSSLKNFIVMVIISILGATLYFYITPLELENPTELLARTNPSIYDVLIALFGGLAGILEKCRKDKGTVMSGVAIATALMPPLCTVGYGIAVGNWQYAAGALYLFFINSVFIALACFIVVKYLRFKMVSTGDTRRERKRKIIAWIALTIIVIPSIVSAVSIIRENTIKKNVSHFIAENKTIGKSYIYDYKFDLHRKPATIDLYIAGDQLSEQEREQVRQNAEAAGLSRDNIVFHEEAVIAITPFNQEQLIKDIFSNNEQQLRLRDERISHLEKTLTEYNAEQLPSEQITKELVVQYPNIKSVTLAHGRRTEMLTDSLTTEKQMIVVLEPKDKKKIKNEDKDKIKEWLKVRLNEENLIVL